MKAYERYAARDQKCGRHWKATMALTLHLSNSISNRQGGIMATLVTGLFKTRVSAERAIESLIDYGYSRDDISLLMSDATRGREFSLQMATKAPEGVATGAAIGGVLGAVAAGLVAVGILVVPGLPLVAAGPVVATLAGLGAGGAAGAVTGGLIGLGLPE